MHRSFLVGVLSAVMATVAWGIMFSVAASVMRAIDPLYMTAIRYGAAAPIFLAILALVEGPRALRPDGQAWRLLFYGSTGYAGFNFLAFTGQKMLGVNGLIVAPILIAAAPFLTALVMWARQGARPRGVTFVSMAVALIGVVLVVTKGSPAGALAALAHGAGSLLVLGGVFSFVFFSLGGPRFPGWSPLRYAALSCLYGTVTLWMVPLAATALHLLTPPAPRAVLAHAPGMLYLVVVAAVIGILAWNVAIAKLGATNAVLFINLVPVVAMAVSALLGHVPAVAQIGGAALTVAALLANNLLQRVPARVPAAQPVGRSASLDGKCLHEDAVRAS